MFQDISKLHHHFQTLHTWQNLQTLQSLQYLQVAEFDSYKRYQENAKKCVAGHVECDLSPIPGDADMWSGPNNI